MKQYIGLSPIINMEGINPIESTINAIIPVIVIVNIAFLLSFEIY